MAVTEGVIHGGTSDAEPWLDADELRWFSPGQSPEPADASRGRAALRHVEASLGDLSRAAAAALAPSPLVDGPGAIALPSPGLPGSRHRSYRDLRRRGWSPRRRRRFATRFVPAATLLVSAAVTLPSLLTRDDRAARVGASAAASPQVRASGPALVSDQSVPPQAASGEIATFDPTSTSLAGTIGSLEAAAEANAATTAAGASTGAVADVAPEPRYEKIAWRESEAHGAPYGGHLHNGVALPIEGRDWITWDPAANTVPNRAWRLYGTDKLVRTIVRVARAHRAANPTAPPLLIGDLSATQGGPLDQHVSHQNGLDVDIYYPRKDGQPTEPTSTDQIDMELAQDLVDRFVAAGAQFIFVGYRTPFSGPSAVVRAYPHHENHLHVRLRP